MNKYFPTHRIYRCQIEIGDGRKKFLFPFVSRENISLRKRHLQNFKNKSFMPIKVSRLSFLLNTFSI